MPLLLGQRPVTVEDVVAVALRGDQVALAPAARAAMAATRSIVEAHLAAETPVYGLNRELGAGRHTEVLDVGAFQRRVLRNHDAGVGELLPPEQVRATMLARLAGFALGGAGVRPEVAEAWIAVLNGGVNPAVRRTGSVGAADLTTLAAIARVISGEGFVLDGTGPVPAGAALHASGLEPLELAGSEALASLSSNAYSVGVGALLVHRAGALPAMADLAAALTIEALAAQSDGGSLAPFAPAVHLHRQSQAASAARIRGWLTGGRASAHPATSVQDAVSIRSAPQISAALADRVAALRSELEALLSASTENPLVADGRMISNGNFQITALAVEVDAVRISLAHAASASERRADLLSTLQRPHRRSDAARVPGLLLYTGSALVAELRHLASPVSLAGSSLGEGVEDVSSHAALAIQLLERAVDLTETVLTIEALLATDLITLSRSAGTPTSGVTSGLGPVLAALEPGLATDAGADALVRTSLQVLLPVATRHH
jgi:histidine ammonia-lyase